VGLQSNEVEMFIDKIIKKSKYKISVQDYVSSAGFYLGEQEKLGTPLVIVIGEKDLKAGHLTIFKRVFLQKESLSLGDLENLLLTFEETHDNELKNRAIKNSNNLIKEAKNYQEFKELIEKGHVVQVY
jgi:prolyl-tRNA synthetase